MIIGFLHDIVHRLVDFFGDFSVHFHLPDLLVVPVFYSRLIFPLFLEIYLILHPEFLLILVIGVLFQIVKDTCFSPCFPCQASVLLKYFLYFPFAWFLLEIELVVFNEILFKPFS